MLRQGQAEGNFCSASAETASLEARGRRALSTDVDESDSWSPSWADDHSNTDTGVSRSSRDSEALGLTPCFPFKVFLGTFRDDNDPDTADLLDFHSLSTEFQQALVEHVEEWPKIAIKKRGIWDVALTPRNQCVWMKVDKQSNCFWTKEKPRFYACMTCANMRRFCFTKHGDDIWLLPLPPGVDGGAHLGSIESFVISHEDLKATMKRHRDMWEKKRGDVSHEESEEVPKDVIE